MPVLVDFLRLSLNWMCRDVLFDYSIFYKKYIACVIFLIVYLDELFLLAGNEKEYEVKAFYTKEFSYKDLSIVRYFLSIEIGRSS